MNQWAFVSAAYGVVVVATLALILLSWAAMRRAEAEAEAVRRR
jgi:hypothetical protein